MTRAIHILMLVALVTLGTASCKSSDNTLRNPNSNYDPDANLPTNAM